MVTDVEGFRFSQSSEQEVPITEAIVNKYIYIFFILNTVLMNLDC